MNIQSIAYMLLLVFSSSICMAQSAFKVNISAPDAPSKEVNISTPISSNFFAPNTTTLKLGSDYQVSAEIPIEQEGIVLINHDYKQLKLIVQPGDSFSIKFSERSIEITSGNNLEGQKLYNAILKDDTRSRFEELDIHDDVKSRVKLAKSMKDKDDEKFKELLKENKINKDFFDFVNLETEMYYKLLLSTDYFFTCRPLIFAMENADKMVDKSFVSAWREIYKDINSKWLQSSFYPSLMGRLHSLDKIGKENSSSNLPYAIDNINSFKSLLSGDLLEYAWGHMIYEGINNNENEKIWLYNWEEFKNTFPNSLLISALSPLISNVVAYHKSVEKRSKEVLVIQERESINTFEELFQHPLLKGKTLYIDLWATWCGPCKAELQNSIKLHDELESIGATPVYISLDRDNAAEKWEEMIYGFPLKGVNIRVSKNFNSFISENLPNFVGIPRYLIVNSRGEITDWNALRPSDGKLLLNALKEAVKI